MRDVREEPSQLTPRWDRSARGQSSHVHALATAEQPDAEPVTQTLAEWLQGQLRERNISQRVLAQRSGVDHSTISRLVRGGRSPSLETVAKLARGLRLLGPDAAAPARLWLLGSTGGDPLRRLRDALLEDELLTRDDVRRVLDYYRLVRAEAFAAGER